MNELDRHRENLKRGSDRLVLGDWYWCTNQGAWRGPMKCVYASDGESKAFWFPDWMGDWSKPNFDLDHIDEWSDDPIGNGTRHIEEPAP